MLYNQWLNVDMNGAETSGFDPYPNSCGAWEDGYLLTMGSPDRCVSEYADWFHYSLGSDWYDVDDDGDLSEPVVHASGWWGLEFMPEIDYKDPAVDPDSEPRVWLYGGTNASGPAVAAQSACCNWLVDGQILPEGFDGQRLDVPDALGYCQDPDSAVSCARVYDMSITTGIHTASKTLDEEKYGAVEVWDDTTDWFLAKSADGTMNYCYHGMPLSCFLTGVGVHNNPDECSTVFAPMTPGSATSVTALDQHLATGVASIRPRPCSAAQIP